MSIVHLYVIATVIALILASKRVLLCVLDVIIKEQIAAVIFNHPYILSLFLLCFVVSIILEHGLYPESLLFESHLLSASLFIAMILPWNHFWAWWHLYIVFGLSILLAWFDCTWSLLRVLIHRNLMFIIVLHCFREFWKGHFKFWLRLHYMGLLIVI